MSPSSVPEDTHKRTVKCLVAPSNAILLMGDFDKDEAELVADVLGLIKADKPA